MPTCQQPLVFTCCQRSQIAQQQRSIPSNPTSLKPLQAASCKRCQVVASIGHLSPPGCQHLFECSPQLVLRRQAAPLGDTLPQGGSMLQCCRSAVAVPCAAHHHSAPCWPGVQAAPEFTGDDASMFYGCYRHLAQRDDAELRKLCCSQFTAVLKTAGAASFLLQFSNTLASMSYDPSEDVRAVMASTFHEVRCPACCSGCRGARPLQQMPVWGGAALWDCWRLPASD
jgi:hypothetical protein